MEGFMITLKIRNIVPVVSTRTQRRAAVTTAIELLKYIRAAEMKSLGNIPDNLKTSHACLLGQSAVSSIDFALEELCFAYALPDKFANEENVPF
jgi:hypothetical protein